MATEPQFAEHLKYCLGVIEEALVSAGVDAGSIDTIAPWEEKLEQAPNAPLLPLPAALYDVDEPQSINRVSYQSADWDAGDGKSGRSFVVSEAEIVIRIYLVDDFAAAADRSEKETGLELLREKFFGYLPQGRKVYDPHFRYQFEPVSDVGEQSPSLTSSYASRTVSVRVTMPYKYQTVTDDRFTSFNVGVA